MIAMTTLRKAMPFTLLLCAALLVTCLPLAAQNNPDCSFTYRFTGDGTQTAVSNLSGNTPCVNWRITLSTDAAAGGTLSSTVTFKTSPDNSTFTAVPNTVCSATVQPPCVLQGANPIVGTQGMLYAAAYGAYVQVVISSSTGTGNGIVRGYGSKGSSAAALPSGGGGGSGTVTSVSFTGGLISVATASTTPAFTVAGTSGGIPYFSSASTWASSGVLTLNGLLLGGGAGNTPTVTAADSTTTHALFATAGAPAFRALASSDIPALAYVTSVGWTGGLVTVATGTTTPAFTVAGTSGGIPYFSSASTWASSGALTQYFAILGGGAGNPPTVSTIKDDGTAVTITQNAVVPFTVLAAGAMANTLYLNAGNVGMYITNPQNNFQIGAQTVFATATPNTISLGGTFSNSAGANLKLKVFDIGTDVYGFGVSATGGLEYVSGAASQTWYTGGTSKMKLFANGNLTVFDQTATTGATLVTITPGASQTSASTILSVGGITSTVGLTFNGHACSLVVNVMTCV